MNPSVSIIIVNYRTLDLLKRCLARIFESRNGMPLEVVVVDNASEDDAIEEVVGSFPEVILLRNIHNLGFSRGVNQGIRRSTGQYILAVNPDTRLPAEGIGPLLSFAEEKYRSDHAGIVGCKLLNEDGSLQYSAGRFPSLRRTIGDFFRRKNRRKYELKDFGEPVSIDWVSGACFLIRRELLDSIGLLDEDFFLYYEEVDLCFRARQQGWEIFYYPHTSVFHFYPHCSRHCDHDFVPVEIRRSHLTFYRKHYSRWQFSALWCLTFAFGLGLLATSPLKILAGAGASRRRRKLGGLILRDVFANGKNNGRVYSAAGKAVWQTPKPVESGRV
jgi:GT2 family glycosyltransferase